MMLNCCQHGENSWTGGRDDPPPFRKQVSAVKVQMGRPLPRPNLIGTCRWLPGPPSARIQKSESAFPVREPRISTALGLRSGRCWIFRRFRSKQASSEPFVGSWRTLLVTVRPLGRASFSDRTAHVASIRANGDEGSSPFPHPPPLAACGGIARVGSRRGAGEGEFEGEGSAAPLISDCSDMCGAIGKGRGREAAQTRSAAAGGAKLLARILIRAKPCYCSPRTNLVCSRNRILGPRPQVALP